MSDRCGDLGNPEDENQGILTRRELQVLQLIGSGEDNGTIAKQLYISKRTVETHVRHIYAKLAVSSRAQAMLFAIRTGLVEFD